MARQFNMTEERLDISRNDIIEIIKSKPKNKNKEDHVRKSLERFNLSEEEVDKILADLDSY